MAVVQVEEVLAAVIGVEGGVGHLRVVVAGHADEEIEVPVAIHVREGGRAHVARHGDTRGGGGLFERAIAAVVKEARGPEGVRHEEIGEAVAVDVARREAGGGDALRGRLRETRAFRDVREVPLPVVAVKHRAHAVADEEVLVAVAVVVEHGHARAGPDVGDQMVYELQGRIVPGRAEAGTGRRLVEAGRRLDPVPKRLLELKRESTPSPGGRGGARGVASRLILRRPRPKVASRGASGRLG